MKKTTIGAITVLALLTVGMSASADTYDDAIVFRPSNGGWYLAHNPGPTGYYPAPPANATTWSSITGYGLGTATPLVGDINGDGVDDVVVSQQAGASGHGFFAAHSTIGGVGQAVLSKATSTSTVFAGSPLANRQAAFLVDVNGDGIDDAVEVKNSIVGAGTFTFTANHSTASGLSSASTDSFGYGGLAWNDTPLMGDFDGNGSADIALFRPGGALDWYVSKSTGAGLGTGGNLAAKDFGLATDVPMIGDINGDGRDDAVLVRTLGSGVLQWWAGFSDVNGNIASAGVVNTTFGNSTAFGDIPFIADINGDGKDDIGVRRNEGGIWRYFTAFTGAGGVLNANGLPSGDESFRHGLSASDVPLFGDFNVVPEPATLGMLAIGGGFLWVRRKFRV